MRTVNVVDSVADASTRRCIATAHSMASTALAKLAITPSPVFFTSVPSWAASAVRSAAKCRRRSSSHCDSPSRCSSSVEPTMSVNRIVIVAVRAIGAG
jgi:hypothetical protein